MIDFNLMNIFMCFCAKIFHFVCLHVATSIHIVNRFNTNQFKYRHLHINDEFSHRNFHSVSFLFVLQQRQHWKFKWKMKCDKKERQGKKRNIKKIDKLEVKRGFLVSQYHGDYWTLPKQTEEKKTIYLLKCM